jgi:putative transposase|tara:strand:- start:566 stop:832 length:267 start_codon:yes stop_codon:yes gene_type:complete
MKKTRYTESQIIKVLNEVEGGRMVKDICREYGISDATYYNWKSKYGGMTASDVKKLKELEDENRRLKRMYADLSLQNEALKDVIEKKL